MSDRGDQLRPETLALDALIKATVSRVSAQGSGSASDALLFMGNWHQSVPSILIQDPVLEPVDKLVWMVIMLCASDARGQAAFPDYDTLARKANVSSTTTIARALALLRLTRWLTQCAKVRQQTGRFTRNIYILHDEPLPLADALYLDEAYMAFVKQSQTHHHARVCRVAQAVSDSLDVDIQSGRNLGQAESALERRLQATHVLSTSTQNLDKGGRYFTFPATVIQRLKRVPETVAGEEGSHLQNLKAVDKHYNRSSCSSHYKKTTTTTTTQNSDSDQRGFHKTTTTPSPSQTQSESPSPASTYPLIYPPRLSENQKMLADRYLATVKPEERQPVLDELQGRLESEHKGMKPVYDELRFLHSLCKSAQLGEFVPNLGIKVVEARQDRVLHVPPPEDEVQTRQDEEARARSKAFGEQQLAKLRESLGMDTKPESS